MDKICIDVFVKINKGLYWELGIQMIRMQQENMPVIKPIID